MISAIGQGFVLTNPFQLAVMTSIIASNGKIIEPTIIKGNRVSFKTNDKYSKEIKIIKKAMFKVVNENKGTAFKSRLQDIKFAVSFTILVIVLLIRPSGIFRGKVIPMLYLVCHYSY